MPTAFALETQNLTLSYNGQPVLSDVSLAVPVGARVAIVGPNGGGAAGGGSAPAGGSGGSSGAPDLQGVVNGVPSENSMSGRRV